MKHDDCLFCSIIDGKLPAAKVYEDDHVYAFLDISQVTEGHTLVVPKAHVQDIYEMPEEIASNLFSPVPKIASAIKKAYKASGINILNNNEVAAGQSVFHIHLHLLPRYGNDDGFDVKWITRNNQFTTEELQNIAKKISDEIK
ncbi:MAG TPA: HIT family protein [Pseudogracilibacillus sp.]|nr:HIT family protein [Pseudogracilibacillus sp.]